MGQGGGGCKGVNIHTKIPKENAYISKIFSIYQTINNECLLLYFSTLNYLFYNVYLNIISKNSPR